MHSDSLSNLLDSVDKSKQTFVVNPENNFIVIGLQAPCNSLAKTILGPPKIVAPPSNISAKFLQISELSSIYNRIIMIDFTHDMYIGRIPIFWWNTETSIIEKLIFRRLFLLTIFNPVSLYEYYVKQGFTIIEEKNGDIRFEKQIDSKKITIGNIAHYFNLIANSFLSLEAVIRIIDKALAEVLKTEVTENTKFHISVIQKDL